MTEGAQEVLRDRTPAATTERTPEQVDHLVRGLALYYTGDDPACTATAVSRWPDAVKLAFVRFYDDAVKSDSLLAVPEDIG